LYAGGIYSVLSVSLRMKDYTLMGVIRVTLPVFFLICSNHIFGIGKATHFKFRVLIDTLVRRSTSACIIYYLEKGCVQSHMST